jgi:hypothetical protein
MRLHSVGFADLETFGDRGRSPWSIDCNNFKVGASDTMASMGGLALHEWLHWDKLFAPIAGPIREWNRNGPMVVIPPDGYGLCNAHVFKLSGRVPTANVENYVWLEVETFLQISVSARYLQIRGWRKYGSCNRIGSSGLINIGGATVLSSMVSLEVEGLARGMRHGWVSLLPKR